MILTVTVNPLLENRIELESFQLGHVNRGKKNILKLVEKGLT